MKSDKYDEKARLVGIVLLNWNGWKDTIKCLNSLRNLDYASRLIIVVDNDSSDDSCSRIESAYPGVKLLHSSVNLGFGGGCNIGIRYALSQGADCIWLLNNDTVVAPTALSALVNHMNWDPCIGAVGSVLFYMNNSNQIQAWGGGYVNFLTGQSRHCFTPADPKSLDYLTAASILLRKEAIDSVGIFDEKSFFMYWEDVDLCYRLRKAGWKLDVAPNSKVLHVESGSLGKKNPKLYRYFSFSIVNFFRRHARYPFFPIGIGVGGKVVKLALSGDLRSAFAVLGGMFSAFGVKENDHYW
ncbi:glycosyltransferase family 2 protein [Polynucleobacter sp. P1-05-14]|uniref:glycosyltransferase family 2 protein n=1 Tax=Polynucleobacter sp. P1-05-14 TaxID=1819732 RepID=UPI001C0DCDB2|nr:glycosyltransferase family 2 protein [Polynucleobacter sp. P1-05-14]MBU3547852.1 glycosyltransferase family 2 protein [Polynucleobacter sp. P1-05-14]